MTSTILRMARGSLLLLPLLWLVFFVVFHQRDSYVCKEHGHLVSSLLLPSAGQADNSVFDEDVARFFDLQPNVDRSPPRPDLEDEQLKNSNLPAAFWNDHKNKPMFYKNESCARFPSILDLKFNNRFWQVLQTSNGTFQLFGAYYETRNLSNVKPAVRILGMIDRIEPNVKTHCQLWFSNLNEPVFGEVLEYNYLWNRRWGYLNGSYQPYLITCKIPSEYQNEMPAAVSLVENPCDLASNNLRVIYKRLNNKRNFAVCVKSLDFLHNDMSVRIVEWIEILQALGVGKIFFYELNIHPNISKVLQYYKKTGRVEVTPYTLPADEPNLPGLQHMYLSTKMIQKRQNELIPYNDCFYKNMYDYRYIVPLDIDEVIIPVSAKSWRELMDTVENRTLGEKKEAKDFYDVRHVYFFDGTPEKHGWQKDIPKYMHMLQHVYRSVDFTNPGAYVRSFCNTERALSLHNNRPSACLTSKCSSDSIPTYDALLHHYREDCAPELRKECDGFRKNIFIDTSIWKFKSKVIKHTIKTLKKLGFLTLEDTSLW